MGLPCSLYAGILYEINSSAAGTALRIALRTRLSRRCTALGCAAMYSFTDLKSDFAIRRSNYPGWSCERPPRHLLLMLRPIGLALRGRRSPCTRGRIAALIWLLIHHGSVPSAEQLLHHYCHVEQCLFTIA